MSSENNNSSGSERGESADVPSTSSALTRRRASDEKLPSVAQNLARLRECEDYNMALALQEQEFSEHYKLNRTERKTVGGDLQKSLEEQKLALEAYMMEAAETARRDEELARNIQRELEEEDRRLRLNQAQLDEELARRLQMEEELPAAPPNVHISDETTTAMSVDSPTTTPHNTPVPSSSAGATDRSSAPPTMANGDGEMAARLQERYLQRFAQKPSRSLDENTQNEFNVLMAASLRAKFPIASPSPQPPPSYSECMRGAGLQDAGGDMVGPSNPPSTADVQKKKRHTEKQQKSLEKHQNRLSDKEKKHTKNMSQSSGESPSHRKSSENGSATATVSALENNYAMANSLLFDSPIANDCGCETRTMTHDGGDTTVANKVSGSETKSENE